MPTTIPACVALSLAGSAIFAIPKSRIFVTSRPEPVRARNTFSGLRSRCTTPRAWAASSPRADLPQDRHGLLGREEALAPEPLEQALAR